MIFGQRFVCLWIEPNHGARGLAGGAGHGHSAPSPQSPYRVVMGGAAARSSALQRSEMGQFRPFAPFPQPGGLRRKQLFGRFSKEKGRKPRPPPSCGKGG